MNRIFLVVVSLLVSSITGWGNYSFSHLTIKDGLSQSTIKSIFQDSKGFLWFGSADGLNKYDGYNFTVYRNDPYNPFSIGGNDISCIYENPSDSVLWIGTQNSGLNSYNRKTNSFYRYAANATKQALPSNNINAMITSPEGRLWIASNGGGIFWFNPADSSFSQPQFSTLPELSDVISLAADEDEFLWLGTDNGLYRYDFSESSAPEKILFENMPSLHILSLMVDRKGFIWIGTQNRGLIRYQPDTQELLHFSHQPNDQNSIGSNTIRCLLQRRNGSIWVGTENGLFLYKPLENNFKRFSNNPIDPESINDNFLFSIMEDNAGTLWLGTYFGGVNKLYPEDSRFSKYSNFHKVFDSDKAINHITGLYKDDKNTVWAATLKGLISFREGYFDNPENEKGMELHFKGIPQKCVFGDSYHNLYVANDSGLYIRKENATGFRLLKPDNLELNAAMQNVMNGFEDSGRKIWFLTPAGLIRYNPETNTAAINNPRNKNGGTDPKFFISGMEAINGKIWVGTIDGELYRYDRYIYQFEKIVPFDDSVRTRPYNRIFSICETEPGMIWFGTNNGLYQYMEKDNKLNRYMDSDGLSNNVVYSTLTDHKKQIWCATNKGVSVLEPNTHTFINYTWEDGLQSNEFNQNAYFKSNDGLLYIGGIDGFNCIDPQRINPNQFVPPVYISGLTVNHKSVTPLSHPGITSRQISETKKITLKHDQSVFSLEFTALNFIHPQKNRYRYMLEGYDKQWIEEGTERTAVYTNINPGEYTFKVQGANNSGIWNPEPATLQVIVLPPFWLTFWFKLLVFTLFLLGIYLVFYLRMRSMRLQTRRLKQLVAEKTAALQETNQHIEHKNRELSLINERVRLRNQNIEDKNKQLNEQNEEIIRQRDKLIQLSEQLKTATQAKINFFTHISHEFRTPLTLIMGPLNEIAANLDVLARNEIRRKLHMVHANATRLLLLVNQLLDFRKIETGKMSLNLSNQDLVSFIRQTVVLFDDLAQRKQIRYEFSPSTPQLEACFDADKIEKIIFNLLSNAFKHTPEKGVIQVALDVIPGEAGNEFIQLSVTDSGAGIPQEFLSSVFEDFSQAGDSQSQTSSGSGIGLALVKKFAELHQGEANAENAKGKGACFKVTLPLIDQCQEEPIPTNTSLNQFINDGYGLKAGLDEYPPVVLKEIKTGDEHKFPLLLIIEDEESVRSYLREVLADRYRIIEAGTAEKGMKLALTEAPALVISDIMLPDASGFDVCSYLKEEYKTCHIPVVLLTALSGKEHQLTGAKCGADAYLNKPFDLQHLFLTIGNLIRQREKIHAKFFRGLPLEQKSQASQPDEQEFLDKVVAEIERNMNDTSFDVEKLCQAVGLSQPQTYRKIKAMTGLSISEFVRNIRLKKAARLLASGNKSVSEVAYEVGFSDPNYFSKCFVKVFGQTPTTYMKMKV